MENSFSAKSSRKFSQSGDDENDSFSSYGGSTYRTGIAPRSLIIQRTSFGGNSSSPSSYSRQRSVQLGASSPGMGPGAYSAISTSGVNAVKSSSDKEKKDMQDLNERFASYIEKVRFLEAQNRRLSDELEKLKSKWGKETSQIKAMYQAELDEARRLLDEAVKEKARVEIRLASLEEQLEETNQKLNDASQSALESRDQIERQNHQLSEYEAELNMLRRRIEGLENDRIKDKKLLATLQEGLTRARSDLDNETLLHIDAENRRQTLEEEIEFLKTIHEQEMKELAALAYRDTTVENREFWKNEMGQALREIQDIYEDKLNVMRSELESYYNLKIQEFRTGATRQNMESSHSKDEVKRLRSQFGDLKDKLSELEAKNGQLQRELDSVRRQADDRERELQSENGELKMEVAKLRAEMDSILKELQDIMDAKLGLELEIAAYRKLLEGEESRVGLRQMVDTWSSSSNGVSASPAAAATSATSLKSSSIMKGEMSAKTTYQKSAKGPITLSECSSDGKFIILDNTGRKEENIGGWKITRTIDGMKRPDFVFENDFTLKPTTKIKIWARGCKPSNAGETDIEGKEETWGIGANIVTKLVNPVDEDKASHIQKTIYS